jgi:hypothetical protein
MMKRFVGIGIAITAFSCSPTTSPKGHPPVTERAPVSTTTVQGSESVPAIAACTSAGYRIVTDPQTAQRFGQCYVAPTKGGR